MKASEVLQLSREHSSALDGFTAYQGDSGEPGYRYLVDAVDAAKEGGFLDWSTDEGVRASYDVAISMALSDEAVGL